MNEIRRVHVFIEDRLIRSTTGSTWSVNAFGNAHWQPYLEVFDEVVVVARVGEANPPPGAEILDLERVRLKPIPYFHGPRSFPRVAIPTMRAIREAIDGDGAFILRLPGLIGTLAGYRLIAAGKPFAVELVGDPDSLFASGVGGSLAPFLRMGFMRATKTICAKASTVSYVTARFLQDKYPASGAARSWHCPSVSITDFLSENGTQRIRDPSEPIRILTAGSLEQRYKGVDILIRSVGKLQKQGLRCTLHVSGDGQYRRELEELRESLGLGDSVTFLGWVPRKQLIDEMERADLFVLASRTEGLPRVIVEAMSMGLAVVGTRVGGIPELLSAACVVPPNDSDALAEAILRLARDPAARTRESAINMNRARDYQDSTLRQRQSGFLTAVRDAIDRQAAEPV